MLTVEIENRKGRKTVIFSLFHVRRTRLGLDMIDMAGTRTSRNLASSDKVTITQNGRMLWSFQGGEKPSKLSSSPLNRLKTIS